MPDRWGPTQEIVARFEQAGFLVDLHRNPGAGFVVMEILGILEDVDLVAVDRRSGWTYGPL
jgi:hypothetical protein